MNDNDNINYIHVDGNKIVNKIHIRWIKKVEECMYICVKSNGYDDSSMIHENTHKACKNVSRDTYNRLNSKFTPLHQ